MPNKETPRIPLKSMRVWRAMEAEHSPVKTVQERLVNQHVKEFGLGYYPALKKMENGLKKK